MHVPGRVRVKAGKGRQNSEVEHDDVFTMPCCSPTRECSLRRRHAANMRRTILFIQNSRRAVRRCGRQARAACTLLRSSLVDSERARQRRRYPQEFYAHVVFTRVEADSSQSANTESENMRYVKSYTIRVLMPPIINLPMA